MSSHYDERLHEVLRKVRDALEAVGDLADVGPRVTVTTADACNEIESFLPESVRPKAPPMSDEALQEAIRYAEDRIQFYVNHPPLEVSGRLIARWIKSLDLLMEEQIARTSFVGDTHNALDTSND